MDFETRGKYASALRSREEIMKAIRHIEGADFHASPDEVRTAVLREYSTRLVVWKSQIPQELHTGIHEINRLGLYVDEVSQE